MPAQEIIAVTGGPTPNAQANTNFRDPAGMRRRSRGDIRSAPLVPRMREVILTIMRLEWLTTYICKPPEVWNGWKRVQCQELNHSRLAMVVVTGLVAQRLGVLARALNFEKGKLVDIMMKPEPPSPPAEPAAEPELTDKAVVAVVATPQAATPPPSPDGFRGVCKAGSKGASPAKGPVPSAPSARFGGVFKSGPLESRPAATPKATASAQRAHRAQGRLKHVISKIHVFKQLELGVDAPQALSEHGQMHRLFFSSLKVSAAQLTIIAKGNVGACRYLLEHEGLLQYFEKVFWMLGQFYGESDFDLANPEPSSLEGSSDYELHGSKVDFIGSLMSRQSVAVDLAGCVEDARHLRQTASAAFAKLEAKAHRRPLRALCHLHRLHASVACSSQARLSQLQDLQQHRRQRHQHQRAQRAQGRLKHVISKIHVFTQLELGVDAPQALSEHGQMHRLKMLNAESNGTEAPFATRTQGSFWTSCALGGLMLC
ncbi:unnamed protein product [Symbiodinium sp. CCMP2592]|nr:unnamed protein product [Symbiodinium sp. CCMP2592]